MCNVLDAGAERWAPHTFPSGKVPPKGADEGRGALMDSFACSAKRNCSPTLISQPAADSFPQGKLCGAFRPLVHSKAADANLREGQAPPLHYDERSGMQRWSAGCGRGRTPPLRHPSWRGGTGRCGHRPLQTVYVVAVGRANLQLHSARKGQAPPLRYD